MLPPRNREIEEHLEENGQNGSQDKSSVKLGFIRPQNGRNQHWQAVYPVGFNLYRKGHLEGKKEDSPLGFGEGIAS